MRNLIPQDELLGKQIPETREEEEAEDSSETTSLTSQTTEVAMEPDSVSPKQPIATQDYKLRERHLPPRN